MIALIVAMILAQSPPLALTTIAQGTSSATEEARQVVVRSPAEWAALWKSHAGLQPAPAVDFSTRMVAAVFLGTRPTAGFQVTISGTRDDGEALVIDWTETVPSTDAMLAQVLTSPFHIVSLPRHDGPVRFFKGTGNIGVVRGGTTGGVSGR